MRKLTREQKRDVRAIAAKRDEDIDFSDAPVVLDWSAAEMGKFYWPKKKPVTMRLDSSDVIAWLKADGRGYQIFIFGHLPRTRPEQQQSESVLVKSEQHGGEAKQGASSYHGT